jgi:hypothetical protein
MMTLSNRKLESLTNWNENSFFTRQSDQTVCHILVLLA